MSGTMMSTREVAEYLGVHEKQVYALIKAGRIPATRATGKWIFLKALVDEWLEADARASVRPERAKAGRPEEFLLAAGSNDPLLELLQSVYQQRHAGFRLFLTPTGSAEGLHALNRGRADIAWSHLLHPESGEYNLPYFAEYLPRIKPVAVNLFLRDLGILTAPGNPRKIRGVADCAGTGVRFLNRQPGSGTRLLLDHLLLRAGVRPAAVQGYDREVLTHREVGSAILAGEADAGLATRVVALDLGLGFVHLTNERFDIVTSQETFFRPAFQALLETIRSERFAAAARDRGGYDLSLSGSIITPTP
jgi:excisionase family DNA binding protein